MKKRLLFLIIFSLLIFLPSTGFCEGVIGVDQQFNINPVQFLIANNTDQQPYVDAFNYFFTIELFCGLLALWIRLVMRVVRM